MKDMITRLALLEEPEPFLEDVAEPAIRNIKLPELRPQFFVPRLTERPQNPIMDTVRMTKEPVTSQSAPSVSVRRPLPLELEVLSQDVAALTRVKQERLDDIWMQAITQRDRLKPQVLSWDALRRRNPNVIPSPFLSEQNGDVFAAARYHVRPPLQDPDVKLVYVHTHELLESLLLTVSGTSSTLHIWDPAIEKFVLRGLQGNGIGHLVIISKDEIVSASLLQRFLTIGNLMRRLETLSDTRVPRVSTPTSHAFAHALSSILAYLRQVAEAISPDYQSIAGVDPELVSLWKRYEDMEHVLKALATLSGRDENVDPADYPSIPTAPNALLSSIYQHLSDHLERASPRIVIGTLAYILTTTSRNYFQSICASVGYNTPGSIARVLQARARQRPQGSERPNGGILEEEDLTTRLENEDDDARNGFPDFITPAVVEVLSRATKSLGLLRAADPDNPLLTSSRMHRDIEWVWSTEQVDNMADGVDSGELPLVPVRRQPLARQVIGSIPPTDSDVLHAFKIFDLTPGELRTHAQSAITSNILSNNSATQSFVSFIDAFPLTLPPSTPTLAHLTQHILHPLVAHATSLSGALVARFLSPTTHLNVHAHLVLLRGYLLLTAHSFKSRLHDALFSDAEELSTPVIGSRTYAAREARENARRERARTRTESGRSKSSARAATSSGNTKGPGRRAVGLSPALTVGDRWPPGGSDLNYHLRTVIVDSLEDGRFDSASADDQEIDESALANEKIHEEGEWRLGFAIRDLPVGTGKEKWLNPLSIEALDFLYLHYQPPHPLDVVITPPILSKYHRMFTFNLRLMRVENVVRTLFRLTRRAAAPLFPTFSPANKLLLHFRFVAHAFIMALSSYVYDIAIGSNMDAFLARLSAASGSTSPASGFPSSGEVLSASGLGRREQEPVVFTDVFTLAEHHSRVLDDILSSCLLRSGQKAVGDILRQCMELVLELGILVAGLKDGELEEYEAAPALEELWGRFRDKMTTFVKVLKVLVEKEADSSGIVLSDIPLHMMQAHRNVSGTTANLHQLLLRLNMSDWWTKQRS
ncbi:Spc98 family-domain-containing protein [Cubamyces menziesii]|nr:Spc98 family-domain-containing protein [Cubamyces menziesii]